MNLLLDMPKVIYIGTVPKGQRNTVVGIVLVSCHPYFCEFSVTAARQEMLSKIYAFQHPAFLGLEPMNEYYPIYYMFVLSTAQRMSVLSYAFLQYHNRKRGNASCQRVVLPLINDESASLHFAGNGTDKL